MDAFGCIEVGCIEQSRQVEDKIVESGFERSGKGVGRYLFLQVQGRFRSLGAEVDWSFGFFFWLAEGVG